MATPAKWKIVMVWCSELPRPHDKFCICICPARNWYLFINSDPPFSRKAKQVVLGVASFQLPFLVRDSYIDTTILQKTLVPADLEQAWNDPARDKGFVPPSLRLQIKAAAQSHNVLTADELSAILND
ncbi:hypothetical protein [Salinarimonas chemoclinalis]|uniref:hypothetical protein n=1 Tax=Salinarimonas chemoclinalis TaxID=3241599 RepID=UPI003558CE5B